jgi:hypothetical protein
VHNLRKKALKIEEESALNDADLHPIQIRPGSDLEGILAWFPEGPSGSQLHLEKAQHAEAVADSPNVYAGSENLLPDTRTNSHACCVWMLGLQLLGVGPHHLNVRRIHHRNAFAGLAQQTIDCATFIFNTGDLYTAYLLCDLVRVRKNRFWPESDHFPSYGFAFAIHCELKYLLFFLIQLSILPIFDCDYIPARARDTSGGGDYGGVLMVTTKKTTGVSPRGEVVQGSHRSSQFDTQCSVSGQLLRQNFDGEKLLSLEGLHVGL